MSHVVTPAFCKISPLTSQHHPTMTRIRCCSKCPMESSASGISRHRKTCTEFRLFTAKQQEFGKHVADAKKLRRAQFFHAHRQEPPENMLIDDTVSILSIICLRKALTRYDRHLSLHLHLYHHLQVSHYNQGVHNESSACWLVIRTCTLSPLLQLSHLQLSHPLLQHLILLQLASYPLPVLQPQDPVLRPVSSYKCPLLCRTGFRQL